MILGVRPHLSGRTVWVSKTWSARSHLILMRKVLYRCMCTTQTVGPNVAKQLSETCFKHGTLLPKTNALGAKNKNRKQPNVAFNFPAFALKINPSTDRLDRLSPLIKTSQTNLSWAEIFHILRFLAKNVPHVKHLVRKAAKQRKHVYVLSC